MAIHWFPGHMAVATREIRKAMPGVDFLLEVLDARLPSSSENPLAQQLRGEKPCVKVLNKADLADPAVTAAWIAHLERTPGVRAIPHEWKQPVATKKLLGLGRAMLPAERNPTRRVTVMILGVPNVGKSTLINTLAGRSLADVSNKPAITKRQQLVPVAGNYLLVDTPGFLWHKLDPPECGYRLAVSGAISDAALEYQDLGPFLVRFLRERYPGALKERYNLDSIPDDDLATLHAIGARRGCVKAGGVLDLQRVCELLVQDFRRGSLGRLSLESPSDGGSAV
jgi:ribosome biogenesis GTPase A